MTASGCEGGRLSTCVALCHPECPPSPCCHPPLLSVVLCHPVSPCVILCHRVPVTRYYCHSAVTLLTPLSHCVTLCHPIVTLCHAGVTLLSSYTIVCHLYVPCSATAITLGASECHCHPISPCVTLLGLVATLCHPVSLRVPVTGCYCHPAATLDYCIVASCHLLSPCCHPGCWQLGSTSTLVVGVIPLTTCITPLSPSVMLLSYCYHPMPLRHPTFTLCYPFVTLLCHCCHPAVSLCHPVSLWVPLPPYCHIVPPCIPDSDALLCPTVNYDSCPRAIEASIWWPRTRFGLPAAAPCPKGSVGMWGHGNRAGLALGTLPE